MELAVALPPLEAPAISVHVETRRLTSATVGGSTSTYADDGDGKRVSKTVGGTTTPPSTA
ncbi:MAG TPA: hypothetical protein VIN09_08425 [Chloroflexota bacterium]